MSDQTAGLPGLLTEKEYGDMRRCSTRTIRRERAAGKGPPVIWLGRSPHYRLEAIEKWLLKQERPPSSRPPSQTADARRMRAWRQGAEDGPRTCAQPGCNAPVDPKTGRPGPKPKFCPTHTTSRRARRP